MSIVPYPLPSQAGPKPNSFEQSSHSQLSNDQEPDRYKNIAFQIIYTLINMPEGQENIPRISMLQKIVENIGFQVFITLLTVASLFMEDFRIIFVQTESDNVIDGLNIAFIVIFLVEIMMSLSIPGYAWSFFFFLDMLSTLSIVLDISLLTNLLYSSNGGSTEQLNMIIRNSKASRAAARTVRVMKIFRLARIVKLYKSALKTKQLNNKKKQELRKKQLKAMKIKKIKQAEREEEVERQLNFSMQQDNNFNKINSAGFHDHNVLSNSEQQFNAKGDKNLEARSRNLICGSTSSDGGNNDDDHINEEDSAQEQSTMLTQQSKISKMLSDSTMKKIIIVILFLMFSVPALEMSNYRDQTDGWDFLAGFVAKALQRPEITIEHINQLIVKTIEKSQTLDTKEELVIFRTPFSQLYSYDSGMLDSLRITDISISESSVNVQKVKTQRNIAALSDRQGVVTIVLNSREFNRLDSWFSILKILFICLVIIYLLSAFNGMISELITEPIQKILEDIKNQGKKDGPENVVDELNAEEGVNIQSSSAGGSSKNNTGYQKHKNEGRNSAKIENNYETAIVHQAISKISKVISKVFGNNGKELIYEKIFDKGTVVENYLEKGKKHYCILGACSIENFGIIREAIGPQAATLCNQISEYLHSAVFRYGGNAIMNGDGSFYVSFKCPEEHQPRQWDLSEEEEDAVKGFSKFFDNTLDNETGGKKVQKQEEQNVNCRRPLRNKIKQTYLNILTDFALCAMVKTIVKINKQSKFYRYRKDTRILKILGNQFQIRITCNLHAGWTSQAFLGSSFKMDLFQFGSALEELKKQIKYTHQCGNNIFISEKVYGILTEGMKRYTRVVQKYSSPDLTNKHLIQPYYLYRVDLNLQNISPPKSSPLRGLQKDAHSGTSLYLKKQLNFEVLKNESEISDYKASNFIAAKKQLREVLKNAVGEQYRKKYNMAFELMENEDWIQCRQIIQELLSFSKEDPLVLRLMNTIPDFRNSEQFANEVEIGWRKKQLQKNNKNTISHQFLSL